jgi:hypothetical protein
MHLDGSSSSKKVNLQKKLFIKYINKAQEEREIASMAQNKIQLK